MRFKVTRVMDNLLARGIDLNAPGGVELFTEVLAFEVPGCLGWSYHHVLDELTVEATAYSDSEISYVLEKLSQYGQAEILPD